MSDFQNKGYLYLYFILKNKLSMVIVFTIQKKKNLQKSSYNVSSLFYKCSKCKKNARILYNHKKKSDDIFASFKECW